MITRRADFVAANRGLRVARPGFVLLANPNNGRGRRYGVTVTKKIGNAVVRNRMKRRLRELLRAALPDAGLPDHDHVLIGREGGIERDFASMAAELGAALARAAAGEGDKPRRRKGGPHKSSRKSSNGGSREHRQPAPAQASSSPASAGAGSGENPCGES